MSWFSVILLLFALLQRSERSSTRVFTSIGWKWTVDDNKGLERSEKSRYTMQTFNALALGKLKRKKGVGVWSVGSRSVGRGRRHGLCLIGPIAINVLFKSRPIASRRVRFSVEGIRHNLETSDMDCEHDDHYAVKKLFKKELHGSLTEISIYAMYTVAFYCCGYRCQGIVHDAHLKECLRTTVEWREQENTKHEVTPKWHVLYAYANLLNETVRQSIFMLCMSPLYNIQVTRFVSRNRLAWIRVFGARCFARNTRK